jgi:hypothetical protein
MLFRRSVVVLLCALAVSAALSSGCGLPADLPTPTLAPAPTATLAAGWKRLENKGISIDVPDTFIGGALTASDQKMLTDNMTKFGSEFEQMAELIKQNPDLYLLFALDSEQTESGIFSNVIVVRERVLSAMDPAAYMKAVEKQLPAQFKVKSSDKTTLFGEPGGKLVVEASLANKNVKEIMYLFKRGDYMYMVAFTTGRAEFDEKLPTIEQSLQTLTINSEP